MAQASPPSERFDPDFYRREYPDVAASGIDPWDHYDGWGRAEGRLPWRLRALVAERDLWAGLDVGARGNLARLAGDADARERGRALWALMVWHAAEGDWPAARAALDRLLPDRAARGYQRGPGVGLLAVAILARTGAPPRTAAALLRCLARRGETADTALARGLLARAAGADPAVALLAPLAPVYARAGLAPPALHGADGPLLDRLAAPHAPPGARWHLARARDRLRDRLVGAGPGDRRAAPLVSVIVPAKDAAATLPTALAGLVAQSWRALEILVVDDGSTDATRAVARAWARRDRRIRVLAGPGQGAYAARNAGMAAARGAFVTVHDADDWSHPARIAEQVRPLLEDPALAATVSHLVRLSPDGVPIRWRMEPAEGWVHRNLSSLMLRAGVRARLGFWDRVRAGGDSEYLERLVAAFGPDALADVRPGLPLSFVRSGPETLTRAATTHIRTRVFGPRRDYETAAQRWHARTLAMAGLSAAGQGRGGTARDAARAAALHLPERPARRPFAAPP
ncbi:MAG: glycosyltransferase family 2 protein, partial [Rhodobacteraceae bacterium]|nr:glycosyltransferase family 2 protein [Paracoccaceae bacterium]